jgi:CubicO group peptidase (beta-lactamase class C family)
MPTLRNSVIRFASGAILLGVACSAELTGPVDVSYTAGLSGFEAKLDTIRVDLHIPGMSAAIVKDEEIVWARGFGFADVDSRLPVEDTTAFHLASLTKTFASTIVMQLVEAGLVDLDDPVSDYGIELQGSDTIRVRHIFTHTSEADPPGSAFQYSGNRFGYLDQVIQSASGRSFGELLVERVLEPLGVRHTAPNVNNAAFFLTGLDRERFVANMASPYEWEAPQVVRTEYPSYFGTAAGLIASARDMARYSIAIDQERFLEPETWDSVFTPARDPAGRDLPYGLGWFVHYASGVKLEWHYGHWHANSSLILRVPERGLAFVVLANTSMLSRAYGLGGDSNVLRSDVARLFVDSFVHGSVPLP